jgi:hypothetical protein
MVSRISIAPNSQTKPKQPTIRITE